MIWTVWRVEAHMNILTEFTHIRAKKHAIRVKLVRVAFARFLTFIEFCYSFYIAIRRSSLPEFSKMPCVVLLLDSEKIIIVKSSWCQNNNGADTINCGSRPSEMVKFFFSPNNSEKPNFELEEGIIFNNTIAAWYYGFVLDNFGEQKLFVIFNGVFSVFSSVKKIQLIDSR